MNVFSGLWFVFIALFITFSAVLKASPTQDMGVVNKQQILYWLGKNNSLTAAQLAKKYNEYIYSNSQVEHSTTLKQGFKYLPQQKATSKPLAAFTATPSNADEQTTLNTVKILAILIDFPDLPHSDHKLNAEDTDMYYPQYPVSHYQQLLFSEHSFPGPAGESLNSAAYYYKEASGHSLNFTGDVYGWVTADHNASAYGERQGTVRDIAAPDLVKEAVEKAVAAYNIDLSEYDLTDLDDIDGDGITNEPNGIIDHVMIFHSSIGEEAGGGHLGTDAIWSHRYFVVDENNQPTAIANSEIKLFGYTINPIDAAIGVVVHEFGHDLGLADEYDLRPNSLGEPVANWSVMSNGSYAGALRGSEPVMFSAYALDYLQNRYQGNWVNQLALAMSDIGTSSDYTLTHSADTSTELSQIKLTLPKSLQTFKSPVEGDFQYYSGSGDNLSHHFVQTITLPATEHALSLTFAAFYSLEKDYDFVQVKVNSHAIAGNYTQANNPYYSDIGPYISGDSFSHPDAQQPNSHLDYVFDLSAYQGQTITLSIEYFTDATTHYYGFVFDDAKIYHDGSVIWQNNAESTSNAQLLGFRRISRYIYAPDSHYYLQLRAYQGIDAGLQNAAYSAGLLLWYSDESFSDNNVTTHPGHGFALVVDADQQQINKGTSNDPAETRIQMRDAAFSLYDQNPGLGDTQLTAVNEFNDSADYAFAAQPESGVILPSHGLGFSILSQDSQSKHITVSLQYNGTENIAAVQQAKTVNFSISGLTIGENDAILWDFGDGEFSQELNPTHSYSAFGDYTVAFAASDEHGEVQSSVLSLTLAQPLVIDSINHSLNGAQLKASAVVTAGKAPYQYLWQLGDGTELTTESVQHQYLVSSEYNVQLTVTDADQQQATQSFSVIAVVPLQLAISANVTDATAHFFAQPSGGSGSYSYSWDFGDGSAEATSQNPTHVYQQTGSYSATLTIIDNQSANQISQTVPVNVVIPTNKSTSSASSSGGSMSFMLSLLLFSLLLTRFKKSQ